MSKSGWRMAAPCPTTTSRRHSPVCADLLEVPVRKRGIKRHQQAITNDCRNLSYLIVLRCIRIVLGYLSFIIVIIWWIQWLWCVVCSACQLQSQLCTWSCASVVVSSSLLWRSLVWWEAQTVWEGRMNHKRNVNYWSNYSGGFIWICQGACPKVQLREDDLPQVLCSPPCSLDQESPTPFVAVCLRCLPCSQPFSTETSAQTTST